METIGDARSFISAAREIALEKPIIVIKPGRSQEAAKAAASHTGPLAGSDEVFEAAMERAGVLRVSNISELFNMASVLGRQPRPRGPKFSNYYQCRRPFSVGNRRHCDQWCPGGQTR